jgi:hypothetical protein
MLEISKVQDAVQTQKLQESRRNKVSAKVRRSEVEAQAQHHGNLHCLVVDRDRLYALHDAIGKVRSQSMLTETVAAMN